jgi:T-complex protein 1 subunit beta
MAAGELDHAPGWDLKRQVLLSATEAAEMILRVDEVVKAAPRPRERE